MKPMTYRLKSHTLNTLEPYYVITNTPSTHLHAYSFLHPLTGSDPNGQVESLDNIRGALNFDRDEGKEGSETSYPTLLR